MYDEEQVTQPIAAEPAPAAEESGTSINWPTVMMAAGISAVVSAIVLSIGLVGLMLSDVGGNRAAAQEAPATVVNLGAQQTQPHAAAPASDSAAPSSDAPAADAPAADAPVADAPAADAPAAQAPAAAQQQTPTAQGPTKPTAAQLQAEMDYLASGASNAQKAQRLEGGARAVNQAQGILGLAAKFKPMGLTYRIVDPVTVNGNIASARLKLSSPGYQPTYMTMKWVWKDGRWKLTNSSICELGSYANIPCNL
ncbi:MULTISPECIES: hypothetical protein [Gordonia]|uniref:Low molecular weight antigen MTB12-like C-terminal domain-containing protein n=2 Tax=Gordonia TaxID=2053 RepID=L7LII8_9ACTN|nr:MULTISPECIES: hypothetical protein [Gordonia]AUH67875.1 hypothetical protein CXX93_05375 [Gordonia sp. YC-JH1]KXT58110.1 hypothetical protein Y710_04430 [Gordonia sp. QH-12]GAC60694.1 hypothetical protein GSI01S_11_00350 [Gordonia sihwensis NBRC 108236]